MVIFTEFLRVIFYELDMSVKIKIICGKSDIVTVNTHTNQNFGFFC